MDVSRSDPITATGIGAVDAVFGVVLLILTIPQHFEFQVEQSLDMLQRDMIVAAAARRHVCWVRHGHFEDSSQAIVTHTVTTGQLRGVRMWYVV